MILKKSLPSVLSLSVCILLHIWRNEMESAISAAIFCCYFLCNQWSRDRNIKTWFFLKMSVKKWKVRNQKIRGLSHSHRIYSTICRFESHSITFTVQIYPLWYSLPSNWESGIFHESFIFSTKASFSHYSLQSPLSHHKDPLCKYLNLF